MIPLVATEEEQDTPDVALMLFDSLITLVIVELSLPFIPSGMGKVAKSFDVSKVEATTKKNAIQRVKSKTCQ